MLYIYLVRSKTVTCPGRRPTQICADDIDLFISLLVLGISHKGVLVALGGAGCVVHIHQVGGGSVEAVQHVDVQTVDAEQALGTLTEGEAHVTPPFAGVLLGEQVDRGPHAVGLDGVQAGVVHEAFHVEERVGVRVDVDGLKEVVVVLNLDVITDGR